VTRPCAGGQKNLGLIPVMFRLGMGPTQSPAWGCFPGYKEVEHEVNCSPVCNGEFKNGGARLPFRHISWGGA
jgi:hypothetical protein